MITIASGGSTYYDLVKECQYAEPVRIAYDPKIRCSFCDMEGFVVIDTAGGEKIHLCMPHSVHYEDALEIMRKA